MKVKCNVPNCDLVYSEDKKDVLFYPFPKKGRKRHQWIEFCELNPNLIHSSVLLYVCDRHFEKRDYVHGNLKMSAMPSIKSKFILNLKIGKN